MKKKILSGQIFLTITALLFLPVKSSAFAGYKAITTDHFVVNFTINNSSCAVALADNLELYNNLISSFLEIDLLNRINVFISDEQNIAIIPETGINISNDIFVSTSENFKAAENGLYRKVFQISLKSIMHNGIAGSAVDENFIEAIIQYPLKKKYFIELLFNDLVNNSQISTVDLKKINKYNDEEQQIIYTVLIDFIIKNYGRKIFIQSLKDADYYDGFFKSLSSLTGDPVTSISEKFNGFLQIKRSGMGISSETRKDLLHDSDELSDISFSVSGNSHSAVLQKNNKKYRLLLKTGEEEITFPLNHSEGGSFFIDLVFIKHNRLAIVELINSGSIIHIFDSENKKYINQISIPLLFISDINTSTETELVFSAASGLASDIYTVNINNGDLDILTETGTNYFPVMLKNKTYFLSNKNKFSIIELDSRSGTFKTLFSTEQEITRLNSDNDKLLVFSMNMNGSDNIFTIDVQSGNLSQITKGINSNLAPQISGKYLYYFSFFKSRYQIFYSNNDYEVIQEVKE